MSAIKGAGIFVIENYKNKLVAVLFGKNNKYADLGGVIDHNEKAIVTACREAREESANLINITPAELKQIAIPITISSYRSYIIYIKGLNLRDYQHNIAKIFKDCKARVWKENNTMIRVPLTNLITSVEQGINTTRDIDNKKIEIRDRTIAIIKKYTSIFNNIRSKPPYALYPNVTLDSRMPCLIGTYTYTLHQNIPKIPQAIPQKRTHRYAVYIIPNLTGDDTKLHKCDEHNIFHISITGFSVNHPPIKPNLEYLSKQGETKWKLDSDTMYIQNNALYFKSNTLDKIAKYLARNSFQKLKGKKFSNTDWHITFHCPITEYIIKLLKKVSWSFAIVRENDDDTYTVLDTFLIKKIE